jgi:FkbM family methyltransferase
MNALSDAITFLKATGSPLASGLLTFNLLLRAAGSKKRVRRFPTTRFSIGGVTYFANSWDGLLVLRPSHEPSVHSALTKTARQAPGTGLFVNVGAHIGRYSLEFAEYFEETIAFEPTPQTFELLRMAADLHPLKDRISIRQLCVGDQAGSVRFGLSKDESQNGIVEEGFSAHTIHVDMVRLDETIEESNHSRVRLLLIDVEGAEEKVLRGATSILTKGSPTIVVELLNELAQRRCRQLLEAIGYRGEELDRTNWLFTKS